MPNGLIAAEMCTRGQSADVYSANCALSFSRGWLRHRAALWGLCVSSSIRSGFWLVKGTVAQHGEQHVASPSRESDESLVVAFALLGLAGVIVPGDRVLQGSKRRQEQSPFEHLVAPSGRVF